MKILIVRHADPDYSIDGLTEKGEKEACLLADRLCKEDYAQVYCSTMGRARLTIQPTLDRKNITAQYCPWLQEFLKPRIKLPYKDKADYCWDILPEFLEEHPDIYSNKDWTNVDFIKDSNVPEEYNKVCQEFDKVLAGHGYVRQGLNYKVTKANHDTIMFVCHFGLGTVLLSHLINCSPYSIWQNTCLLPTSVTTLYTEERREGLAAFRATAIGDVSHLYAGGEEPAFAGRFCECFTDNTRHD